MTDSIAALRRSHDDLLALTAGLSSSQLRGPSGCSDWSIAQVLSHLGSGAEIGLAGLEANLAGEEPPSNEANVPVWDRWNAMGPDEQASSFRDADARLVARFESVEGAPEIKLPFLPAPIPFDDAVKFRLSEHAVHAWDVRVGLSSDAVIPADAAALLVGRLPLLAGWLGRPDAWTGGSTVVAVQTTDPSGAWSIALGGDSVVLSEGAAADAATTLALPTESFVRLVYGRLPAEWTPPSVSITGEVSLDQLRQVFPGF